jgi:hypothetical protein
MEVIEAVLGIAVLSGTIYYCITFFFHPNNKRNP